MSRIFQPLVSLFAGFLLSQTLIAQTTDRPWLAEVNLYPVAAGPVSRLVADKTVDSIDATRRYPGASLVRRLSPRFSAGYFFVPRIDFALKESWGFADIKDGRIILKQQTGGIHAFEGRWHPFRGGFHASMALVHARSTVYDMDFTRTGSTAVIGARPYPSDFDARWIAPSVTRPAAGAGCTRTLKNGLTLSASILIPIPARDGGVANLTLTPRSPISVDSSDVVLASERLRNEVFYAPVQFRFGVGYSFRLGRR